MTVRLLLADDQQLVRAGFAQLLSRDDSIEVIGEAEDGRQAVDMTRELQPDVVLMDIRMPVMDGLEATSRIVGDPRSPETRIVVLTTFELDEYVFEALRLGASGFLLKDIAPDELRHAVHVVAKGESLLSPSVTSRLIAEYTEKSARPPLDDSPLEALTDREREVLCLVAEGLGNHEIGERLFISPATAKTHVSRTMTKLGAHDRAQLVVIAYETGLVSPGEAD